MLVVPTTIIIFGVLGYAILIALKDSFFEYPILSLNAPGTFVGFDNYISLFQNPHFQNSVVITFIFVFGTVIIGLLLSFILALSLYNLSKSARLFRTLVLVPYLISGVAAAKMWNFMFNSEVGFVNFFIKLIGGNPILWLSSTTNALIVVTLANIWKIFPMSTLLLLAGLQVIDSDLHDASAIDGANSFQSFIYITIPLLSTYIASSLIWLTFASFNMFSVIYPLTGGGPIRATEVMAIHMYDLAFKEFNFSRASAVMIMLLLLNSSFSLAFVKLFRRRT